MKEVSRPSSDSSGSRSILSFNKPKLFFYTRSPPAFETKLSSSAEGYSRILLNKSFEAILTSQSFFFLVNKLKFKVSLVLFMLLLTIEISLLIIERTSETEI